MKQKDLYGVFVKQSQTGEAYLLRYESESMDDIKGYIEESGYNKNSKFVHYYVSKLIKFEDDVVDNFKNFKITDFEKYSSTKELTMSLQDFTLYKYYLGHKLPILVYDDTRTDGIDWYQDDLDRLFDTGDFRGKKIKLRLRKLDTITQEEGLKLFFEWGYNIYKYTPDRLDELIQMIKSDVNDDSLSFNISKLLNEYHLDYKGLLDA